MIRKIIDAAALISLVLSTVLVGGVFQAYKYVSSPKFEKDIKNKIIGDVQKALPGAIDKNLPKVNGIPKI